MQDQEANASQLGGVTYARSDDMRLLSAAVTRDLDITGVSRQSLLSAIVTHIIAHPAPRLETYEPWQCS